MNLAQGLRRRNVLVGELKTLENRVSEAMSYTEGGEVYSQQDFEKMQEELRNVRGALLLVKMSIDAANHQEVDDESVQSIILAKGEFKATLEFTRRLRGQIGSSRREMWSEDAPEQKHRLDAKFLDAEIDKLTKNILACDDKLATRNASITLPIIDISNLI